MTEYRLIKMEQLYEHGCNNCDEWIDCERLDSAKDCDFNLSLWETLPKLDLEAVKEVCNSLIRESIANSCGESCCFCKSAYDGNIKHSDNCPVIKAQSILKQIKGVKE